MRDSEHFPLKQGDGSNFPMSIALLGVSQDLDALVVGVQKETKRKPAILRDRYFENPFPPPYGSFSLRRTCARLFLQEPVRLAGPTELQIGFAASLQGACPEKWFLSCWLRESSPKVVGLFLSRLAQFEGALQ